MKKVFQFFFAFVVTILLLAYLNNDNQKQKRAKIKIPKNAKICLASWYGPGFHGKRMANGKIYNQYKVLVAHKTLPLGTKVRVTNLLNGKKVIADVSDRGPYKRGREIDLSYGAAAQLRSIKPGVIPVKLEVLRYPYSFLRRS